MSGATVAASGNRKDAHLLAPSLEALAIDDDAMTVHPDLAQDARTPLPAGR